MEVYITKMDGLHSVVMDFGKRKYCLPPQSINNAKRTLDLLKKDLLRFRLGKITEIPKNSFGD